MWDDLDRFRMDNSQGVLNRNFLSLAQSKDVYVNIGFHKRFGYKKLPIVSALRLVLSRYSNPSFSLIIVGHLEGLSK